MEDPDARFRLAVQWHPEVGHDPRLFEALVAAVPRRACGPLSGPHPGDAGPRSGRACRGRFRVVLPVSVVTGADPWPTATLIID